MEATFEPLEKSVKKIDINKNDFFRRTIGYTLLDDTRNEEIVKS